MPVPSVTSNSVTCADAGTDAGFGPRREVGVVVDHHRDTQPFGQAVPHLQVDHTGEVGRHPQHALAVDEPGHADTHGDDRRSPAPRAQTC